jgi:hypothetical protein
MAASAVIDTDRDGWEAAFERVTQTGEQTGNHELESYVPEKVEYRQDGHAYLVLSRGHNGRWTSGKIRSRRNLTQLAPNGGRLQVLIQGPNIQNASGDGFCSGIWPACWAIPDASAVPWSCGGEIDIMEVMHFPNRPDTARRGFSTLHFSPTPGKDYVYPGHWGLKLAEYAWDAGDKLFDFEWHRESSGAWRLSLTLNGAQLWSLTTTRDDVFRDAEHRPGLNPEGFRPGEAGDPARVFQRAFDNEPFGYKIVVNLAYGGTPFSHVDESLRCADLVVKHIKLEAY